MVDSASQAGPSTPRKESKKRSNSKQSKPIQPAQDKASFDVVVNGGMDIDEAAPHASTSEPISAPRPSSKKGKLVDTFMSGPSQPSAIVQSPSASRPEQKKRKQEKWEAKQKRREESEWDCVPLASNEASSIPPVWSRDGK